MSNNIESIRLRADTAAPAGFGFLLVRLALDLAAVSLAWRLTAEIRLSLNPYMAAAIPREAIPQVAPSLMTLLALWLLTSLWLKTYQRSADAPISAALFRVAEASMGFCGLAIIATFFVRILGEELSRSFVLLLAPITFLCLVGSLAVSIQLSRQIQRRWPVVKRVAVLGSEEEAEEVISAIRRANDGNVEVRGLILPARAAERVTAGGAISAMAKPSSELPMLGATRDLAELINQERLDRIIIASQSLDAAEAEFCAQVMKRMGVTVTRPIRRAASDVTVRYRVEYGLHVIDVEAVPFSHWQEVIKRGMDLTLSLMLITLLLPLFAFLAVAVLLTSSGPVFYKSPRVGKGGRYFTFWKFRSMYVDGPARSELAAHNERSGHFFKIRRDPRITPLGRLMRRFSLDELPQLFNVLAGEMSLVGPRPLPAEDLDKDGMSRAFAEWAEQRSLVRPGITGLWQVNGRSDLPFERTMELDLKYIRDRSIALDLRILFQTPAAVLSGRGAY
jgi:exopolysaccharide biosynthesis polyprenyl glycosylphosphotransferase